MNNNISEFIPADKVEEAPRRTGDPEAGPTPEGPSAGLAEDEEDGAEAETTAVVASSCCWRRRSVRRSLFRAVVMLTVSAVVVGLAVAAYFLSGLLGLVGCAGLLLAALFAHLVVSGKYQWFYIAALTTPRDLKAVISYIRLLCQIHSYGKKNLIIADVFRQNVEKHPNKACFLFEDQTWTFAQVEEYSNRVASVFRSHGYRKGDKVALFLENRPEFVAIWLGLSKLGVIVPLINTNLRLEALVHSIKVGKSQALIYSLELADAVTEIADKVDTTVTFYRLGGPSETAPASKDLNNLLKEASPNPPTSLSDKPHYHDHLLYIYTSGTTGMPKAAVITNARFTFMSAGMHWMGRFRNDDVYYTPLPLYHTAGGVMSIGQALLFGSTVVIRKKFSASAYFTDCKKYGATIGQYIGEMCRYILATPPKSSDTDHSVHTVFGNGLRPQIWKQFVTRFNISNVREFYGATEGNANIVNIDNREGAIGFVSRILPQVYPISIIKADPATGEPIRGPTGLCQLCEPNEPGVFIGKITPNIPSRAYLGYVDSEASNKKVVHDVFSKGDSAFISGDLLISDKLGYLYFVDRTGDTFRWKGENVSTSEVEAVISNIVGYKDCVVYGAAVPGLEGRAGMAAILDEDNTLDMQSLSQGVTRHLPVYARPQFIRILQQLEMTGTFKLKKTDLQKEGFNPSNLPDKLYYLDNTDGSYLPLTKEAYDKICSGKLRL